MWRFKALGRVAVDVYNWLLPLVAINILWFLLSLTVVLMPPATAALYEIAYLARKGYGPGIQAFFEAFRRWLAKSWLWGIGTLLVIVVGWVALSFYGAQEHAVGGILVLVTAAILTFVAMVQFYFWPYMLAQETPRIRRALRNAAFTVLADPLLAFTYGGVSLALVIVGVLLVVPIALIVPVVIVFLGTYSLLDWLEHYQLIERKETPGEEIA